jgi:hypothetical protein
MFFDNPHLLALLVSFHRERLFESGSRVREAAPPARPARSIARTERRAPRRETSVRA